MPHDWRMVEVHWSHAGASGTASMEWYGESLWRARLSDVPRGASLTVRAVDAAGNEAVAEAQAE